MRISTMRAGNPSTSSVRPFQLSLHIRHPSVDPAEISRQLGPEADECFRAGAPRRSQVGLAATSVYAESYWVAALNPADWVFGAPERDDPGSDSESESSDSEPTRDTTLSRIRSLAGSSLALARNLDIVLAMVCGRLQARHGKFLELLRQGGGQIRLLVTLSPKSVTGLNMPFEVSRALGAVGVHLEFEFSDPG
jgi:hypothetical protein